MGPSIWPEMSHRLPTHAAWTGRELIPPTAELQACHILREMPSAWKEMGSTQEGNVRQMVMRMEDRICWKTETEEALLLRNPADPPSCPSLTEHQDHTPARPRSVGTFPEIRKPTTLAELQAHPRIEPPIPAEPTDLQTCAFLWATRTRAGTSREVCRTRTEDLMLSTRRETPDTQNLTAHQSQPELPDLLAVLGRFHRWVGALLPGLSGVWKAEVAMRHLSGMTQGLEAPLQAELILLKLRTVRRQTRHRTALLLLRTALRQSLC